MKNIRSAIKNLIKEVLSEVYELRPTGDGGGFFGGKDIIYKTYDLVDSSPRKRVIGKCKVEIPTEESESKDVNISYVYEKISTSPKEKNQTVLDTANDLVEDIEDDINNNKFIYRIVINGVFSVNVRNSLFESFKLSFPSAELKILGNQMVIELEPSARVDSLDYDIDPMGRKIPIYKGQPTRRRHIPKPNTTLRKRKPKS